MVFDDAIKGFAVRVSAKGVRTFVFQYRRGNQVKRLVLGRYGIITPAQARKAANIARGKVEEGRDPVADRAAGLAAEAAERAEARQKAATDAFTLAKLADLWAEKGLASASASHKKEAPAAVRRAFAKLLTRPADSLHAGELQRVVDAMARNHPTMARRSRDYGRAMFNWAQARELVTGNPFAAVRIETREVSRDRALSDAELGAVWRAATAMDYPFGPLLRLLILTLQRRSEVAGMRWAELDQALTTWTLPADRAKNRKAHIVPLPAPARAIMRELAERPRLAGQRLVFTTTGKTPVSGFANAMEQVARLIDKAAKEAPGPPPPAALPWHLHDLRRTGVTTLARLGVAPHVADRLLNHVQGTIRGVAAVYQRHDFMAEREAAAGLWAAHVLAVGGSAGGQQAGTAEAGGAAGISSTDEAPGEAKAANGLT
jgi:integrase